MMSGSDLSKFGYIDPFWRPREYASQFAELLSCPHEDTYRMMNCLRDNKTLPWQIIIEAQERIRPNVRISFQKKKLEALLIFKRAA